MQNFLQPPPTPPTSVFFPLFPCHFITYLQALSKNSLENSRKTLSVMVDEVVFSKVRILVCEKFSS